MPEILFYMIITLGLTYSITMAIITRQAYMTSGLNEKFLPKGVSVLKPLKNLDDGLEENLHTFFEMDYPEFELLFAVNDRDDPAIAVVRKLQRAYPEVLSKLIVNERQIGLNPKINNLHNMYAFAKYDYILISDSNVRVQSNYLFVMMGEMMQRGVGLVTATIRGSGSKSTGALLENLQLNTFIAGSVFTVSKLFNRPITIGKSMLLKRDVLDRINGFKSFASFLAEDHLIGQAINQLGYKIVHSAYTIDNINEKWTLRRFFSRHLRWAKMRKNLNVNDYIAESLSNPVAASFMLYMLEPHMTNMLVLFMISVIKAVVDWFISRQLESGLKWYHFLLVPLKDIIIGIIWLIPFFSNKIDWRGNSMRIRRYTRIQPAKS